MSTGVIRSVVFWVHLTLGVCAGVVIFVMSLTGALLGYQRQITNWVEGAPRVTYAPGAQRLPLDTLLARASILPTEVSSVVVKADPALPVQVGFLSRGRQPVSLDPYTAAPVQASHPGRTRAFFAFVRRWHEVLGANKATSRERAAMFTGAATLAFTFMIPLGFLLWWPVTWNKATVRATVLFKRKLGGRARDFNWHNVAGLWCCIPLFLIALSGVFMSYRWPALWLDRALGSPSEKAAAIAAMSDSAKAEALVARLKAQAAANAPRPTPPPMTSLIKEGDASLSSIFSTAAQLHPAWQSVTIALPSSREKSVQVVLAEGNTYRPDLRWTLLLDPATLATTKVTSYDAMSLSHRLRAWYRFTHTGEVFGWFGQTIATLACLGAVLLSVTGIMLAIRRLARWRRRAATA